MNLHRFNGRSDWDSVPAAEHNPWQKLAAATEGVITPANAVSLAGGYLTVRGLLEIQRGEIGRGLSKAVAGRLLDLADGAVAHATGTKGPVGEAIDVIVDKADMAVALPALVRSEALPATAAVTIGAQNVANSLLGVVARKRGKHMHSSESGKLTTFAQWTAFGAFVGAALAEKHKRTQLAEDLRSAGYLMAGVSAGMGAATTTEYAATALE